MRPGTRLNFDEFAQRLTAFGWDARDAQSRAAVLSEAAVALRRLGDDRGEPCSALLIPGRLEFLGKHTDYGGGRSLLCAVQRGFAMIVRRRSDRLVRIVDATLQAASTFEIGPDLQVQRGHWSNYAMTVARRLARNFAGPIAGADIAFASDLPPASGMSSSSALLTGFFLAMAKVNRLPTKPEYAANIHGEEDLAGYLGTIENGQTFGSLAGDQGVGTFGGSEDHTAIVCSRPEALRQYSFCPVRFEGQAPLPSDYTLAIASSGVVAEKTGEALGRYNHLCITMQAMLRMVNNHAGRNDPTMAAALAGGANLARCRQALADYRALVNRLTQFHEETNVLIPAAVEALASSNLAELGRVVDRSQYLAETVLQNQTPETIFLARSARENGAIAASAFGAGFGGSVWALVGEQQADDFLAGWRRRYIQKFPARTENSMFFLSRAGRPATELADP